MSSLLINNIKKFLELKYDEFINDKSADTNDKKVLNALISYAPRTLSDIDKFIHSNQGWFGDLKITIKNAHDLFKYLLKYNLNPKKDNLLRINSFNNLTKAQSLAVARNLKKLKHESFILKQILNSYESIILPKQDIFTIEAKAVKKLKHPANRALLESALGDLRSPSKDTSSFHRDFERAEIIIDGQEHSVATGPTTAIIEKWKSDFLAGLPEAELLGLHQGRVGDSLNFFTQNYQLAGNELAIGANLEYGRIKYIKDGKDYSIQLSATVYYLLDKQTENADEHQCLMILNGEVVKEPEDFILEIISKHKPKHFEYLKSLGYEPLCHIKQIASVHCQKKPHDYTMKISIQSDYPELLQYVGPSPTAEPGMTIALGFPYVQYQELYQGFKDLLTKSLKNVTATAVYKNKPSQNNPQEIILLDALKKLKSIDPQSLISNKILKLIEVSKIMEAYEKLKPSGFFNQLKAKLHALAKALGFNPNSKLKSLVTTSQKMHQVLLHQYMQAPKIIQKNDEPPFEAKQSTKPTGKKNSSK